MVTGNGDDELAAQRAALAREIAALRGGGPDVEATLHVTRGKLERLEAQLQTEFEEAFNAGDTDRTRELDGIGADLTGLIFEVNQLLMWHLDNAPEVVESAERMEAINVTLDAAADNASHTLQELKDIAGTVTELASLVDNIKTLAG